MRFECKKKRRMVFGGFECEVVLFLAERRQRWER